MTLTITITPEMVQEIYSDVYSESENFSQLTEEDAAAFLETNEVAIREEMESFLWELVSESEEFWPEETFDEEGEDTEEEEEEE